MTQHNQDAPDPDGRKHVWYVCGADCTGCQYCLGGLSYCTECRKGEAELDEYCPGNPTEAVSDEQ